MIRRGRRNSPFRPTPSGAEQLEPRQLLAAAGDLDTTFGEGGKQLATFNQMHEWAEDVAIAPDGNFFTAGSYGNRWVLAKYKPDGSLDRSFDDDGYVVST